MDEHYYVYILASKAHGILYVGCSNDLVARVYAHREELAEGFTKKYHIHNWDDLYDSINQ